MHDTSTAKVFIIEKSLFKVLQYKMPKIELDTTYVNKITIYFITRVLFCLFGTIQVLTPISIHNFHFINILTPFLFYLKNINIFSIYFNNIPN